MVLSYGLIFIYFYIKRDSMLYFIVIAVCVLVVWNLPIPTQLLVLGLNFIMPDPIPYIDEIRQVVGIVKSISKRLS